jgi:hypothetical protein
MTFLDNFISLTVSLALATPIPQGLGPMVYVAIEDSSAISGGITTVSSTEDVATLLAATEISAQAAADLDAAFAQNSPPSTIFVATYDGSTGDPEDALDAMVAAGNFFGVIAQESRVDADNANLGAWVNANSDRRWRRVLVCQSSNADLVTSGKPAALSDCAFETCLMCAHDDDTEPAAAGLAGVLAGHRMTLRPLPLHTQVRGVALPGYTSAQRVFAKANDACVLIAAGTGASASILLNEQTRTYGGFEAAAIFSLVYLANREIAALGDMVANKAQRSEILRADAAGAIEVAAVLDTAPAAMAATSPSHFTPGSVGTPPNDEALPDGYSVTVSPSGTELLAQIITRFGPEATGIGLDLDGIVAQEG